MVFSSFCGDPRGKYSADSGWDSRPAVDSAVEKSWASWATYQVVEYAFVQAPLSWSALPQLLVVVVQALIMGAELLKAGLVDVLNTAVDVSERLMGKAVNYPNARLPACACADG